MYLSYYGLTREPFHITPDPEFLFQSPSHREAFAAITYGVEQRKGFIAVTGEVGTGKTTIVRAYLKTLNLAAMQTFYLYSPDVSFDDLLRLLLTELGEDPKDNATTWILRRIQWKLIQLYEEGRGMLLVIDEAQNMPVETLERLRTLSNLETTEDKLLQIVLVGQPELDDKLNLHQLRQLKQRIAVRATLRTLTQAESMAYIRHRFERAGGNFYGVFAPRAVRALLRHAKGSPRALNILCDNVLLAGFGAEQRPIRAALVNEVARDLDGVRRARSSNMLRWPAAAAALLAVGVAVAGWAAWSAASRTADTGALNIVHAEALAPAKDSVPATLPAPSAAPVPTTAPAGAQPPSEIASPAPLAATAPAVPAPPVPVAAPVPAPAAVAAPAFDSTATPPEPTAPATPVVRIKATPAGPGELTRVIAPGENLTRLLLDVYGHCDPALIRAVQQRNPGIVDVNMIVTGQTLVFPVVDGAAPGGPAESPAGS